MKENGEIDISVIIVSYNPSWEKLIFTLDSIIVQKNVKYEIIVADDGSANNMFDLLEQYFLENNIKNYNLVANHKNRGTVWNLESGLRIATGRYVKAISPGDSLYCEDILNKMMTYMEQYNYKWIFSDAFYYKIENGKIISVNVPAHPQNNKVYLKGNENTRRWNYVVLDDVAVGATMLCKRDVEILYCEKILDKVKYTEDNIFRMMMFDGIIGGYYPENSIYYEYGTGISTVNSDSWNRRIREDWEIADSIMFDENRELDQFQRKMIQAVCKRKKGILSKIMVKGKLKQYLYSKTNKRMTEDR